MASDKKNLPEVNAVRHLGAMINDLSGKELFERGRRLAEDGLSPEGKEVSLNARTTRVFSFYWVAAEKGDPEAMQALAEMYFYGLAYFVRDTEPGQKNGGIPINYKKALDWYEQLHRKGITPPEYALSKERHLEELKKKRAKEKGR